MNPDRGDKSCDQDVTQKKAEKKVTYKKLCIVIERTWNMKPTLAGATGTMTKFLKRNLERIQ
jgi:hypothetical protein